MRKSLHMAIGTRCPYCDRPMDGAKRRPTRDHVHRPKADGGTLTDGNRLIVCHECNVNKGSASLDLFHANLVSARDPRAKYVAAVLEQLNSGS